MFNVGDYLVYRKDVCQVIQIKEKNYNNIDYYVLTQIDDPSLKRELPIDSNKIRSLITKKEVQKLINSIPEIEIIDFMNDRSTENDYRKHIESENHEDLIKVIKTSYLRIKEKIANEKKTSAIDENYLKLAEKYLYTELSITLNEDIDEIKKIITDKLES